MRKTIMAVMLTLGLLLLTMPTAVNAASGVTVVDRTGAGIWSDNTWQVEIYPGETKSTTIKLYNSSSSTLDVEATIIPDSLDSGNLTFELDKSSFTMSGWSYADVTLTVRASGSATPGTYTAELGIRSEVPPAPTGGGGGISTFRLYDLTIENITESSADVLWRTSRSTTSELTYWSEFKAVVEDESYLWEHTVHLEELKDNTTYHFEITCRDKRSLEKGTTGEFTTLEKRVVPMPEPAIPEPEEPVLPEPTEPEVVEPEEEPALPEEEEPEVVEPEEEEPYVPEPKETPWVLIGGVVGGLAAAGGIGYWLWQRRRKKIT